MPKVVSWSYGVTTCSQRTDDLLPRTLDALRRGGFDAPRLFADGVPDPRPLRDRFGLEVTARWPQVRTAANWILGMVELYLRDPTADRFALFQDDLTCGVNLRAYLDRCPFPQKGYWNLYTFPENEPAALTDWSEGKRTGRRIRPRHQWAQPAPPSRDFVGWYPSNQNGKGAVGLVFSREGLRTLFQHNHLFDKPTDPLSGHKRIDGGVVEAMRRSGWIEYVHSPSLLQHTGRHSSMGNRPHPTATSYRGDGYNCLDLLPQE